MMRKQIVHGRCNKVVWDGSEDDLDSEGYAASLLHVVNDRCGTDEQIAEVTLLLESILTGANTN